MTICTSCANVVSNLVVLLHTASAGCNCACALKGTGIVTRKTEVLSNLNETKDCIFPCSSNAKKIKKVA